MLEAKRGISLIALWLLCAPSEGRAQADIWAPCRNAQDAQQKIDLCSQAIPHLRNPKLLERAYNRRGLANMEAGRYDAAIADFSAVISLNPKLAGYYDNRQAAYRRKGDISSALKDANTAVKLAPRYSFVYRSRGFLYEDAGRIDLALADFDIAVGLDANDASLHVDRGRLLAKVGRLDEGIADLSLALALDPKIHAAYRERGIAHARAGNRDAALADLSLFLRLEPSDEEGRRAFAAVQPNPEAALPGQAAPRPQTEPARTGKTLSGTGFFVTDDGDIVTNNHVVQECGSVSVRTSAGDVYPARVLSRDAAGDLALLKVPAHSSAKADVRVGIRLGEAVAAFGFPLTGLLATSGNFTTGNVAALSGLRDNAALLQVTVPVQPGNSGGPLLDTSGNVVGVVVGKLNALRLAAATDDLAQNVNFAIKSGVVLNFLEAAGVAVTPEPKTESMPLPDIADKAKAISVWIACQS